MTLTKTINFDSSFFEQKFYVSKSKWLHGQKIRFIGRSGTNFERMAL